MHQLIGREEFHLSIGDYFLASDHWQMELTYTHKGDDFNAFPLTTSLPILPFPYCPFLLHPRDRDVLGRGVMG